MKDFFRHPFLSHWWWLIISLEEEEILRTLSSKAGSSSSRCKAESKAKFFKKLLLRLLCLESKKRIRFFGEWTLAADSIRVWSPEIAHQNFEGPICSSNFLIASKIQWRGYFWNQARPSMTNANTFWIRMQIQQHPLSQDRYAMPKWPAKPDVTKTRVNKLWEFGRQEMCVWGNCVLSSGSNGLG